MVNILRHKVVNIKRREMVNLDGISTQLQKYCLDTNVLIQAWQKYYAPAICPSYWEVLNDLGIQDRIFIPKVVFEEITRTEDDLSKWIKKSNIPVRDLNAAVTKCLSSIYAANPGHKFLVDNTKQLNESGYLINRVSVFINSSPLKPNATILPSGLIKKLAGIEFTL